MKIGGKVVVWIQVDTYVLKDLVVVVGAESGDRVIEEECKA
jgi:hypothetical protein